MKKIVFILSALFITNMAIGQIKDVSYSLKYNSETCLFDCYLVINSGNAKTTIDRAQFNSQVSVVIPRESTLFVEESYMPLKNNQSRTSNEPAIWDVTSWVNNPADLPESKIYAIAPLLSPTGFYNDLKEGDEIKMFSMKVHPLNECGKGVRLFDNDLDPTSTSEGMSGSDFSNGFTIGGISQKYNDNRNYVYPSSPVIESLNILPVDELRLEINARPASGECQKSLQYDFYGPNGYIGDYGALASLSASQIFPGEYKLRVTDELGCMAEKSFFPRGTVSNSGLNNGLTNSTPIETKSETRELSFDGTFASEIYPNPAQNDVNLLMTGKKGSIVAINIFDITGSVLQKSFSNLTMTGNEMETKLETNLSPGMYSLMLTIDGQENISHKLLIIK